MARLNRRIMRGTVRRTLRGTLLVEAAIVMPVVILMTFVLIEGGWLMLKAEQIENAARQGARVAALNNSTNAQVDNVIKTILHSAGLPEAGVWTVSPTPDSAPNRGTQIKVTVTIPYGNITLTKVPLLITGKESPVTSSVTMTKE